MNRKKALSAGLVALLAAALTLGTLHMGPVSGRKKKEKTEKEAEAVALQYSIGIVNGRSDGDLLITGFTDALTDALGEGAFVCSRTDTGGDPAQTYAAASEEVSAGCSLLFAIGDTALSSADSLTKDLPIVGAGIMDYPDLLSIPAEQWDGRSWTNVAGVSSLPDMEAVLSLLIEATPDLTNVGLLYSEGDRNSILQNRIMETYLDEAGIPWKEYVLPVNVDPEAAAAAEAAGTPLPTLESMAALAATECSALYLPADSALSSSASGIGAIARSLGKALVTADGTAGESALVCAYQNPYAEGYQAGTCAVRILQDNAYPGDLDIVTPSAGFHKLYNGSWAEALGRTFPQSFSEYSEFFTDFDFSSDVDRKAAAEKDS